MRPPPENVLRNQMCERGWMCAAVPEEQEELVGVHEGRVSALLASSQSLVPLSCSPASQPPTCLAICPCMRVSIQGIGFQGFEHGKGQEGRTSGMQGLNQK